MGRHGRQGGGHDSRNAQDGAQNMVEAEGSLELTTWGGKSRKKPKEESRRVPKNIPSDSPLGLKLCQWDHPPNTKGKDKIIMIWYCMVEWTKEI